MRIESKRRRTLQREDDPDPNEDEGLGEHMRFLRQKNSAEEKKTTLRIGSPRTTVGCLELMPGAYVQCSNQVIWLDLRPTRRFEKYNTRLAMNSAAVLRIVSDFRERLLDSSYLGQCKVVGRDELRGASDIPKELDSSTVHGRSRNASGRA